MANPTFFGENHEPRRTDTRWRVLEKILGATIDHGGGGGGGNAAVTVAAGAPPVDGSIDTLLYKDSVTSTIYVNSGSVAVPVWDAI